VCQIWGALCIVGLTILGMAWMCKIRVSLVNSMIERCTILQIMSLVSCAHTLMLVYKHAHEVRIAPKSFKKNLT
jgi:hypothetical protein